MQNLAKVAVAPEQDPATCRERVAPVVDHHGTSTIQCGLGYLQTCLCVHVNVPTVVYVCERQVCAFVHVEFCDAV